MVLAQQTTAPLPVRHRLRVSEDDREFTVTVHRHVVDVPDVQVYMFHGCRLWRRQSLFHGTQIVENIVEMSEIPTVQGTKTPESLGTALVRQLVQEEIVEVIRDWITSACRIRVTHVRHGTRLRA